MAIEDEDFAFNGTVGVVWIMSIGNGASSGGFLF